jgi:hypothetical protein
LPERPCAHQQLKIEQLRQRRSPRSAALFMNAINAAFVDLIFGHSLANFVG